MTLIVVEPPTQEPVSLAEVYEHLRFPPGITSHPDDKRLSRLVRAGREQVETHTRRALCQQTLRVGIDDLYRAEETTYGSGPPLRWPTNWGLNNWIAGAGGIDLPRPPVIEVTAIQYYDAANVQRSIDVSQYRLNTAGMLGRLEFVSGFTFPSVYDRGDAASVLYIAGYPAGLAEDGVTIDYAANVPETIKDCILQLVERSYDAMTPAEEVALDDRLEAMLATYRIWRF